MTLQFKTSINCGSCLNAVTPMLDRFPGIENWSVDITVPEKILTVEGPDLAPEGIVAALDDIGYDAELVGAPAN